MSGTTAPDRERGRRIADSPRRWRPDLLVGYEATDISLPEADRATAEPDDTTLVATLVRRVLGRQSGAALPICTAGTTTSSRPTSPIGWSASDLDEYGAELGQAADQELKSTPAPPLRVGWLRAIRLGHARIAAGLQLPMPVLVLLSARTQYARTWHEGLHGVDTVLDVDQIARRAVTLGRQRPSPGSRARWTTWC